MDTNGNLPTKSKFLFLYKVLEKALQITQNKLVGDDVKAHRFALEKARYKFRRKEIGINYGREQHKHSSDK